MADNRTPSAGLKKFAENTHKPQKTYILAYVLPCFPRNTFQTENLLEVGTFTPVSVKNYHCFGGERKDLQNG